MTTAFVLSGGGSLGAVQVGMLQALADQGIRPDLLVGTSAGALNAAYVAGHGADRRAIDGLAQLWQGIHSHRLFRLEPRRAVLALMGKRTALFAPDGLADLVSRHLAFGRLEDAAIPLRVVACDLLTGVEVTMATGPAHRAILASCAIPGIFPPVAVDGHDLIDGALSNNTAISVAADADEIYVLPSGYPCALTRAPGSALGVLAQAASLLLHQRIVHDTARYAESRRLVVLPPPCPITVASTDFRHAPRLISDSYIAARDWLAVNGGRRADPAAHVAMHVHPAPADDGNASVRGLRGPAPARHPGRVPGLDAPGSAAQV